MPDANGPLRVMSRILQTLPACLPIDTVFWQTRLSELANPPQHHPHERLPMSIDNYDMCV